MHYTLHCLPDGPQSGATALQQDGQSSYCRRKYESDIYYYGLTQLDIKPQAGKVYSLCLPVTWFSLHR